MFQIIGAGHCLGSRVISNAALAEELGLSTGWFIERTGVVNRRVCAEGESVLSLAVQAVRNACKDANVRPETLGSDTLLLHIQNGFTHLTPPGGIVLSAALGFRNVRVLSIDGVCAEPIAALEVASLMLEKGRCRRVIISASVDFLPLIDPQDLDTVGLFGAGAGAILLERSDGPHGLRSIDWQTDAKHWDLGLVEARDHQRDTEGVTIRVGYYQMQGTKLARVALRALPSLVARVMAEAAWAPDDIDYVVSHQPNARMLAQGIKALGLRVDRVGQPVTEMGNLGPASLLVSYSLAKEAGRISSGSRVLLVSFGLGFSAGVATLVA